MPGFSPVSTTPIASTSAPAGQSAPTITQRPLTRCCCPDCDCCGACADVTPCAYSVKIGDKWYYLKPYTLDVADEGTCIYRWTGSVTLGSGTITTIQLYLWNRSDPAEPYSITLSALGDDTQVWERNFGLSKIDCSRSYTLPAVLEPLGALGDAEVVPVKVRQCCCTGCGDEGTPGSVSIQIPDGAGGTLTITATRPRYGGTSIMYCDRFSARIAPITIYGAADLDTVACSFPLSSGMLLTISNSTTGAQVAWLETTAGPFLCDDARTLAPSIGTYTPPGNAIVTPGDLKICDSPVCCETCGTFTPQQWTIAIDGEEFTVYANRVAPYCTWTNTFERQLIGGCYADTISMVVTKLGGLPADPIQYEVVLSDSVTAVERGNYLYLPGVAAADTDCSAGITLLADVLGCGGLPGTITAEPNHLHACGSTVFCDLPCVLADEYSIAIDGFSDDNFVYEHQDCTNLGGDVFTQEEYHCPKCSTYNGEWFAYQESAGYYLSDRELHCHKVICPAGQGVTQELDVYSVVSFLIFCDQPDGTHLTLRATQTLGDAGTSITVWQLVVAKADFDCYAPYDLVFDSSLSTGDGCAEGQDTPPTCTVTPLPT